MAAFLGGACGGAAAGRQGGDAIRGEVIVFAAASLTAAFREEAAGFTSQHPAARVTFNYAGSASLVTAIANGAPADVFASADSPNMDRAVASGETASAPVVFASNRLEIVVPAANPRHVTGLASLADPGTVVVLCAPQVPCGNYSGQALARAGVRVSPKSQEQDVNAVLTKVAQGEADAGIVYRTDVQGGGGRVRGVTIPDAQNVIASYPIVALRGGPNPAAGRAFIEYVLSAAGQSALARHGFGGPAAP